MTISAITSATYTASGSIEAVINGVVSTVPDDMKNARRRELALWVADGNLIAAYAAPPPTAEDNRQTALKADPTYIDLLNRAKTATPAEIDAWFAANVTTLPQARGVLAAIVKYIATRL